MKGTISIGGALQEVCKYVTKMSSFFEVPASRLPPALKAIRGRRMVDTLGEFRSLQSSAAKAARDTYLDTHATSDGRGNPKGARVPPHRRARRRTPLREIGAEMIAKDKRPEWLLYLRRRICRIQEFRHRQLSKNHPHATFFTLDGQFWYGKLANESVLEALIA